MYVAEWQAVTLVVQLMLRHISCTVNVAGTLVEQLICSHISCTVNVAGTLVAQLMLQAH